MLLREKFCRILDCQVALYETWEQQDSKSSNISSGLSFLSESTSFTKSVGLGI